MAAFETPTGLAPKVKPVPGRLMGVQQSPSRPGILKVTKISKNDVATRQLPGPVLVTPIEESKLLEEPAGPAKEEASSRGGGAPMTPPVEQQKPTVRVTDAAGVARMGRGCAPSDSSYWEAMPSRPPLQRFYSLPSTANLSPARHHYRLPNVEPRMVKETPQILYVNDARGLFINQYRIIRLVGEGSYGMVYLAIDPTTDTQYAIKEYDKLRIIKLNHRVLMQYRRHGKRWTGSAADLIREEIAIMKRIDHPNLVTLYEVLDDPRSPHLYMVLEWCAHGTIMPAEADYDGKAKPLDEEQCRIYFRDLILAVEYLHAHGIMHRDIKADNVLLDENGVLKLADFGVSQIFDSPDNDTVNSNAGSPAYMAPELAALAGAASSVREIRRVSGRRADIWAMGVLLFYMLHGRLPFEADSLASLYDKIQHATPAVKCCSPELQDLFAQILEKEPEKRIPMSDLREHPWVTREGTDLLLSYEENTQSEEECITAEDLQSAIDELQLQHKECANMNIEDVSRSLRNAFAWRGASLCLSRSNSNDCLRPSLNRETLAESADSFRKSEETPRQAQAPAAAKLRTGKIERLTQAIDEVLRSHGWIASYPASPPDAEPGPDKLESKSVDA